MERRRWMKGRARERRRRGRGLSRRRRRSRGKKGEYLLSFSLLQIKIAYTCVSRSNLATLSFSTVHLSLSISGKQREALEEADKDAGVLLTPLLPLSFILGLDWVIDP